MDISFQPGVLKTIYNRKKGHIFTSTQRKIAMKLQVKERSVYY